MGIRIVGAALVGLVFGYAGSQLLHLQWATLIPWALGALGVGALCRSQREALIAGAAYGLVLGFAFMIAGYNGTDPVAGKLPFFAIIGVVSAPFGAAASFVGWWRWHRWGRNASS
jgi:hypothetical protein